MGSKLARTVIWLGLALGAVGCGEDADEGATTTTTTPVQAPTPPTPAEPPGPSASGVSFDLRAEGQPSYGAAALSQFAITLTAKEPWHVNQEYPIAIRLTAPAGVALAKSALAREDAAEIGEEAARFDVPFTPSAPGEHEVQAQVSFAMCTEENCVMEDRTLALRLAVR